MKLLRSASKFSPWILTLIHDQLMMVYVYFSHAHDKPQDTNTNKCNEECTNELRGESENKHVDTKQTLKVVEQ